MGPPQSLEKNLSDYKNNERIGIYHQFEENGRIMATIAKQLPT
jgi:antitoxin component YwqK of YwqJK toxin-antitoxin module